MRSIKRIALGLLAISGLAIVGLFVLAWRPGIAPITPPAASGFSAADIALGEALAGAGNCAVCHTRDGGDVNAGGRAMPTPFGTLYTTNITPDEATGIGNWSQAAFNRAMRKGVGRQGQHYFPAFPYTHYTKVSDADLTALYAFLMSRPAATEPDFENTIAFPFNIRALQAGWKLLFFDKGRYTANDAKDEVWNRGAYLAEGLGHCSACHTPRNALGAEQQDNRYAGATVDGWYAPALTPANTAPVRWTREPLYEFLRTGATPHHGVAVGSMSEVVHVGLAEVSDDDIDALAVYFADLARPGSETDSATMIAGNDTLRLEQASVAYPAGEHLYTTACASCHYNEPANLQALRPELSINPAVAAPTALNFVNVILRGVALTEGAQHVMMPGFANTLDDDEIRELAAYLRATTADRAPWNDIASTLESARSRLEHTMQ